MNRYKWADRILKRALPGDSRGQVIRAELDQEHANRLEHHGAKAADQWLLRQAVSVAAWALRDRLLGRTWKEGSGPPAISTSGLQIGTSIRTLARAPGYSLAVIGTLGLALAATVSVFAVVRGVLIRPLPYPEAETLVRIDAVDDGIVKDGSIDYPSFLDWREHLEHTEGLAAWVTAEGVYHADRVSEVWSGIASTADLLPTLGVSPHLGSWYGPGEGGLDEFTIYLSFNVWERRFGADPDIVGKSIRLAEASWTVHGVMPPGFSYPSTGVDYWIPLRDSRFLQSRGSGIVHVVGRLTQGSTLEVANVELQLFTDGQREVLGTDVREVLIRDLDSVERDAVSRVLWMLFGAVGVLLLIACVNVSGIALARAETRRAEFAVRMSIGASRGQLRKRMIVESAILSVVGGILGIFSAIAGVQLLLALAPADLPGRDAIAVDYLVVGFAFTTAIAVGILAGVIPGARAAATSTFQRTRGQDPASRRTHAALAAAQLGCAVVLLAGSVILLRSFASLTSVETGFDDPGRILTFEMGLSDERYRDASATLAYHRDLLDRIEALPGVERAGLSTHLPFSTSSIDASIVRENEPYVRGQVDQMGLELWNGEYRDALGLPLLRGRDPRRDPTGEEPVREVVVNEAAAALLTGTTDALGTSFSFDVEEGQLAAPGTFYTIVGIVPDVLDGALDDPIRPRAYYDLVEFRRQYGFVSGRYFYGVVRTTADPLALAPAIRDIARDLDPRTPIRTIASLESLVGQTTLPARFRTVTLTLFAGFAVAVALLGVYSVTAFSVHSGLRTIGIRMALGAPADAVRRRVILHAAGIAVAGGFAGIAIAFTLAPILDTMLFEVSSRDPATFITVLGLTWAGALTSALLPARRAGRVDPIRILREE